jgi:hypothetical protein
VTNPHQDEHGNVLCFNGEIFQGPEALCGAHANDGSALLKALAGAKPSGEIMLGIITMQARFLDKLDA